MVERTLAWLRKCRAILVRYNKNAFPNVGARSMDFLIKHGYAVVEPDAPIIGGDLPNNNYVHDLRNNLAATIEADGRLSPAFIDEHRDDLFAELEPTSQPANPVTNMPDSRCRQLEDKAFYCLATADRYAIETSGETLLDTQQQVAAQYVMLMSG